MDNFETWFAGLVAYANSSGMGWAIAQNSPESYREYFDDGCSPQEVIETEISYL